jgi:hypothetical protein
MRRGAQPPEPWLEILKRSSIQLLGDLLFRISGIAAKADLGNEEGEEDEVAMPSADASRVALVDTLGKERRDRVLAAVYITRQDSSSIVRSTSVHIWKALVNVRYTFASMRIFTANIVIWYDTEHPQNSPRNHAYAE